MRGYWGVAMVGALAMTTTAHAANATREPFGMLADGTSVEAVTLTNDHGVVARIISYGATLQSLEAPDRNGKSADIVLGYATLADYVARPNYFGVTVGRYANRIARGRFSIDGHAYTVATNDGPNALHGGIKGFDKAVWKVVAVKSGPTASVTLGYVSPDGEEGYPGTLSVTATYSLDEANALSVDYRATTDKPTIVNLTNHSFFNLAGEASDAGILGHVLRIDADAITPVGATLIPTGALRPVAGTPFDFREATAIGERIRDGRDQQIVHGRGYDHNYVINGVPGGAPRLAARLEDPASGRVLELLTDQPGVQYYSGNFLDGTVTGKGGRVYRQSDGLALEPQLFPDTPNQPRFGSARLAPGQTYRNHIVYRLLTATR